MSEQLVGWAWSSSQRVLTDNRGSRGVSGGGGGGGGGASCTQVFIAFFSRLRVGSRMNVVRMWMSACEL